MPKKGEKLTFKVLFQYPGQPQHTRAFSQYNSAEAEAGTIGQNGATVTVLDHADPANVVTLAKFGPDEFHLFDWFNAKSEQQGLYCRCGRHVLKEDDGRSHMYHAGLCWECWGTGAVAERATRDGGLPIEGNLTRCPVCGGSGQDADVSYFDIDTSTFYNRLAMLRLASGLEV